MHAQLSDITLTLEEAKQQTGLPQNAALVQSQGGSAALSTLPPQSICSWLRPRVTGWARWLRAFQGGPGRLGHDPGASQILQAAEARVLLTLSYWSGTILSRRPPQIPFKMNLNLNDRAEARLAAEGSH